ncbi:MAG: hypothetical protein EBS32_03560, partial [Actinobacteria bacterium]|nr:hypothetical protein [Actinomycetota bacterium]
MVGRNFTSAYENYDYAVGNDTQPHRLTQVLFTSGPGQTGRCTWVAPAGIRKATLVVVGGGGAGGSYAGGGGAGGGVAIKRLVPFVAGNSYDITVGAGGLTATTPCSGSACNGG